MNRTCDECVCVRELYVVTCHKKSSATKCTHEMIRYFFSVIILANSEFGWEGKNTPPCCGTFNWPTHHNNNDAFTLRLSVVLSDV